MRTVLVKESIMSSSKLQKYMAGKLSETFGHLKIYENHRPDWLRGEQLERLELDFFIPTFLA